MKAQIFPALLLSGTLFMQGSLAQDMSVLRINVVEGDNAVHNLKRKAVSPTVVEVRDAGNRPVPDARVRFTLPAIGPGGRFAEGERVYTTHSNSEGRATMASFAPNGYEGSFTVVVEVNSAGREANAALKQTNGMYLATPAANSFQGAPAMRSSNSRKVLLILGIGAAAAVAGILATQGGGRGGSAAVTTPPATIGIGGIGVGGPQ